MFLFSFLLKDFPEVSNYKLFSPFRHIDLLPLQPQPWPGAVVVLDPGDGHVLALLDGGAAGEGEVVPRVETVLLVEGV